MIESIEIKNFRCFKDTKIAGFGLLNLFGGLNNSGKTALLEAIYFMINPIPSNLLFIHKTIRKESSGFMKESPQNAWDNLFFQQDKKQEISLDSYIRFDDQLDCYKTTLNCAEESLNLISVNTGDSKDEKIVQFSSTITETTTEKSAINIHVYKNSVEESAHILIANSEGIHGEGSVVKKVNTPHFIEASAKPLSYMIAQDYDKARFNNKEKVLLKAFQVVDKNIEKIETFSIGNSTLFLTRKNENRMPIGLFGDAINKVAYFILKIINSPNSIVLIDEIENGIHYTKQAELWEMLFKLAIEFNVQIFSTSHSLEMIKAFANVAKQFPEQAAYFEMARSPKTGIIKGVRHDVNTLVFELDRNMTIRGE